MRARDNPFSVERVLRIRYRPLTCAWDQLLEQLQSYRYRAAIVGAHGSGKTTLLEDLEERLRPRFGAIRLRLDHSRPRFLPGELEQLAKRVSPQQMVFFDGAEQLGTWGWRRLLRATQPAAGLVITTHRPGRLPTLLHSQTTCDLLESMVQELLPADLEVRRVTLESLFRKHRGNLRDVLRELYDWYAGRAGSRGGPLDCKGRESPALERLSAR